MSAGYRPLVRRGWLPRRYRRDDESSYLLLILVMLGPLGSVLMLLATPIWLTYLGVRWALRRLGALDEPP